MRKRTDPAVLRFHKFKQDTSPSEYFFSESLLYKPFKSESEIEDFVSKLNEYEVSSYGVEIKCVKKQVMEFLEDVT